MARKRQGAGCDEAGPPWRRGAPRIGAALLLALACLAGPTRAEVLARLQTVEYPVRPAPGASLREALDAASPVRWEGRLFHADTRWQVRWTYRWFERGDGSCRITGARVELEGRIRLPRLEDASPAQQARFDRYLAALRLHELGHYQFGRDAAHEIEQRLLGLPGMPRCAALEAAAEALAQRTLEKHRERERDYDRRTGHGLGQGAVLEP